MMPDCTFFPLAGSQTSRACSVNALVMLPSPQPTRATCLTRGGLQAYDEVLFCVDDFPWPGAPMYAMRNCLSHWLKSTTHCFTCSTAETAFSHCEPLPDAVIDSSSCNSRTTLLKSFYIGMSHK